ncbi:hypothetical protein [Humisphaera borealis]|uniref:Uncharacterized protein n=1 Tax=Humisphaera borealis TaxID=2807512 RepID=A0A7M2X4G7_9BACT|nr:hypothetical protein [Humisphaera borealis]QOV91660.1 hypothetical protein IPV69_09965 [Humisphaera borealis]
MRYLRIIFVSLIAVGVCGGVYIGLTLGLAAYVSYRTGSVATAATGNAPGATSPAANPAAETPPSVTAPVPAMEDAASLLRRTWLSPRQGLTSAAPFVNSPVEGKARIVGTPFRPWLPTATEAIRPRHYTIEKAFVSKPRPLTEAMPIPMQLILAPPEAITFPALPPVRVMSPESDRIRLSSIASDRNGELPSPLFDTTIRSGEAMLLAKPAPGRSGAASPERLGIPSPTPYDAGPTRTALPEETIPMAPPDRPETIRFTVN